MRWAGPSVRSWYACFRSRLRQDAAGMFLTSGLLPLILLYNLVRTSLVVEKQNKTKNNAFMKQVIINMLISCEVRRRWRWGKRDLYFLRRLPTVWGKQRSLPSIKPRGFNLHVTSGLIYCCLGSPSIVCSCNHFQQQFSDTSDHISNSLQCQKGINIPVKNVGTVDQ